MPHAQQVVVRIPRFHVENESFNGQERSEELQSLIGGSRSAFAPRAYATQDGWRQVEARRFTQNEQTPDNMSRRYSMDHDSSRRSFLRYVGFGIAGALVEGVGLPRGAFADVKMPSAGWVGGGGIPAFSPVGYPLPLPSDLPTLAPAADRLARYEVKDELQLPVGWRYDVVAQWGDRFGDVQFGTAADFTGLVPVAGTSDEFHLIVNHEYISGRPWLQGMLQVHGVSLVDNDGRIAGQKLLGMEIDLRHEPPIGAPELRDALAKLCDLAMRDLGVSVLRVKRDADGGVRVIADANDHFRIYAHGAVNTDASKFSFTGPAAELLGGPRGTFANCSGGTSPWGTFLSCEENFQDQVPEFVTPSGTPKPADRKLFKGLGDEHATRLPFEFEGLGTGLQSPLDGRQYGWVIEVDPVGRTMKKHTWLGRFRHENVALRVEVGKPLVAYMGDDRRGGHVWKFISNEVVMSATSPETSRLLERGTLHVAKWSAEFTGRWIPLTLDTPLVVPTPAQCATGHIWLPNRPGGGHVAVGDGDSATMTVATWIAQIEAFAGKPFADLRLRDLCEPTLTAEQKHAVLLMDAYVMANAAGGTPTARPEDIEVHPLDRSVYIAFTDSTGSDDGSPDVRIFPDSQGANSRQYGAIYRLAEQNDDPAATQFTWGRFVASGEVADGGGGFACADNLAFDPAGHLWMVCDITTPRHNFAVSRQAADRSQPGGSSFVGIFGNNAMFCIPCSGPRVGQPHCFAIGPMECELTGPTFLPDGRTLLIAIQHPGEFNGTRGSAGQPTEVVRQVHLIDEQGKPFIQQRRVPLGSNFPAGQPGSVPRAAVVAIRRN